MKGNYGKLFRGTQEEPTFRGHSSGTSRVAAGCVSLQPLFTRTPQTAQVTTPTVLRKWLRNFTLR
jgi:hypothetical protein